MEEKGVFRDQRESLNRKGQGEQHRQRLGGKGAAHGLTPWAGMQEGEGGTGKGVSAPPGGLSPLFFLQLTGAPTAQSAPSLRGKASFMEQCTSWGYARTNAT